MSRDHKTNSFCARRSIKALKFIYMCFFSTVWTLLEGAMWHYRRKTEHMEEGGGLSVLLWRREGARRWYPVTVSGSFQGCTRVGGRMRGDARHDLSSSLSHPTTSSELCFSPSFEKDFLLNWLFESRTLCSLRKTSSSPPPRQIWACLFLVW